MNRHFQRRGVLLAAVMSLFAALMSGVLLAQGSGGVFGKSPPPQAWSSLTIPQAGPP
jgi:hypothetical protein